MFINRTHINSKKLSDQFLRQPNIFILNSNADFLLNSRSLIDDNLRLFMKLFHIISAKNFSVALKNARPVRKITKAIRPAVPSPTKSMPALPLITPRIDSITAASGFKINRNFPDDLMMEVGEITGVKKINVWIK